MSEKAETIVEDWVCVVSVNVVYSCSGRFLHTYDICLNGKLIFNL